MADTLDLKSRLSKLRLAGVKQDQHVKDKQSWDEVEEDYKAEQNFDPPYSEEEDTAPKD